MSDIINITTESTCTYIVTGSSVPNYSFYSTNYTNNVVVDNVLTVEGDINFNGVSLKELLEKIQDRLGILVPDPKHLEKHEALRNAYENYKLIEKLLKE